MSANSETFAAFYTLFLVYYMRFFLFAAYGLGVARPYAYSAAVALFRVNAEIHQRKAGLGRAFFLFDVGLILVMEVAQSGKNRVGSGLAEAA